MTQSEKKKRVIDILFDSFYDNKSVNFVVKQDEKKDKRIRVLLNYSYDLGGKFGQVYLTEDNNVCAILVNPAKNKTTLKTILWDLKLVLKCIGLKNVLKVMKRESHIKKHHPKTDFTHLWYIGVCKKHQGLGLGTQLMKTIIADNENKDLPIYLETSMRQNFPFYENLGFENKGEIKDGDYVLRMYMHD